MEQGSDLSCSTTSEDEMKTEYHTTKYRIIISKTARRLVAAITIIQLLVSVNLITTQSVSAQRKGQGDRGQRPGGVFTTNLPHITGINGLKETTPGVARIIPQQKFNITGQNFRGRIEDIKIFVLKRVLDAGIAKSQTPGVSRRERFDTVSMATANVVGNHELTATITTHLPAGEYFLQVEVAGFGKSNLKRFESTRLTIDPDKLRHKLVISIEKKTAKPKEDVGVRGNFLKGYQYHIWFYYQADRSYRYPLIIDRREEGFLRGKLPEHAKPGVYDVFVRGGDTRRDSPSFGSYEESNTVNFTVEDVSPDYFHRFEIEYRGFECLKESADGPGSDEIYMAGLLYRDDLRDKPNPHWTRVYDRVDAGDKRIDPQSFLTFGKTIEDQEWNPQHRRYALNRFVMVVALGEFDGDARWHGAGKPGGEVAEDTGRVLNNGYSRTQLIEKVKEAFRKNIDNAKDGFSEDDCLGVEELTFTDEELQKAVYLNGQPLEKSLHFRGDDSHYRVIFHLRLAKPGSK